jgi:hypothetical protein
MLVIVFSVISVYDVDGFVMLCVICNIHQQVQCKDFIVTFVVTYHIVCVMLEKKKFKSKH